MALLSHLLTAVTETSLANSSYFICDFKRLFIFVQALIKPFTCSTEPLPHYPSYATAHRKRLRPQFFVNFFVQNIFRAVVVRDTLNQFFRVVG